MILQRLCELYERLERDPEQEVAPPGFTRQKIHFAVVLEEDGRLHAIQDLRQDNKGRPQPVTLSVPDCGGRTSAIKPQFLWDKPEYLFGVSLDEDEPDHEKGAERAMRCFDSCREAHLNAAKEIWDSALGPVAGFFESWTPEVLTQEQGRTLRDLSSGFGVFRIRGRSAWLHEQPTVAEWWQRRWESLDSDPVEGQCLVTGRKVPLARLHPKIKGVRGAQTSGGSLVSFNLDAFESYGKQQSFNAPVGRLIAFKYTTALNKLLERESRHRVEIGDTTCVFWADEPSEVEDLFGFALSGSPAENEDRRREIGAMLRRLSRGQAHVPEPGTGFHVLGLAPNAARLSIRFWLSGTAGELLENALEHERRLEIVPDRPVRGTDHETEAPRVSTLLAQTAREAKDVPPLLGGALVRSILSGARYPEALYTAVLRRIRADRRIDHPRAALLKAVLMRNHAKEIHMTLEPERPETAYQLGRLLAALEKTQSDALGQVGSSIKDTYFGAASATPSVVFPRLMRLTQHHQAKLEGGRRVVAEKRIQEICGRLDEFPARLDLAEQGLFVLGYYHQRQDFFVPRADKEKVAAGSSG